VKTEPTDLRLAHEVAERLNGDRHCPFYRQVRFDSKGLAPLLVSDLCRQGASDVGTSLVGLAKVGLSFDTPKSPEWLAMTVVEAINVLQDKAPELLAEDKVLTPPPDATKGSAVMLIGRAVALAYRMCLLGEERPGEKTKACLADAARETLHGTKDDCKNATRRRSLLGRFVRGFFSDLDDLKKTDGLPERLLEILSGSAFGPPSDPAPAACPESQQHSGKDWEEVRDLLRNNPEMAGWTDRAIGRRCGVDGKTAKKLRRQVYGDVPQVRMVERKGASYFMGVSKIGKTPGRPPSADAASGG